MASSRALIALALAATIVPLAGVPAHAAQAATRVNDYPYRTGAADRTDRWNFKTRECTSFAAWRVNHNLGVAFKNRYKGQTFGNAGNWDNAAKRAGVKVNGTASVGAVAEFDPHHHAGSVGHVAYVYKVSGSYVYLEEYNFNVVHGYGTRKVLKSWVSHFIHFR